MALNKKRKLNEAGVGDVILNIFMVLICFLAVYPVWYTVVISFNNAQDAMRGGIYWWPRKFSLQSYKTVFQDKEIMYAFFITIVKTILGTATSVFFTSMVAFAFSKSHIMGHKVYMVMGTITMFFGGGLIPYFILIKNIGLYNNFLIYIIPALFNFYNMIIFMTYFREMSPGLEESAKLDGANDFLIFVRIILPLSMPVVATIALFNGVGQWNDYFTGVMFISNSRLQPIQTYLYRVVASSSASRTTVATAGSMSAGAAQITSTSVRLATMVVTTVPIICVYPFLQKYFVKGFMVGSIKG